MQYILTKEELDKLTPKEDVEKRDITLALVRQRVLFLANFVCIHERKRNGNVSEYCDGCPCGFIDPVDGVRLSYEQSKLLCSRPRSHSK